MALNPSDQYHTYDGRLNSFLTAQTLSKRRTSSVSSKAPKSIKWPHSFLLPEEMAKAGFFHYPTQENPDNTICFLCRKSIDSWEEDDNPLAEHLKLSPGCGWAIVASIDARDGELSKEYPLSSRMIEARKATFGDRWPHEDKKGWKCKIKQLVDAGWKYTPTPEYDDMATCAYCELALDGWEPSDKPMDEHHKRSPDCSFFALITAHQGSHTSEKPSKARKSRMSKASRVSTQSSFAVPSEAPSIDDLLPEEDDSIVTTATTATVTSQAGRKMAKGKKPTKGRKTKTKKEEAVEASSMMEPEDDDFEVKVAPPKATRGKKRPSEVVNETSIPLESQPPPTKRRGTRTTRGSVATADDTNAMSALEIDGDTTMTTTDDIAPKKGPKGKRGRPSGAKSQRSVSTASKAPLRLDMPDDEEIDRALQADLERPLTDEEDDVMTGPAPKTRRQSRLKKPTLAASAAPVGKPTRSSKITRTDYDMFATEEVPLDENAIEAELEAMEVEESKPLPKAKNSKSKQPRKPSAKQQAAAKRAADIAQAEAEAEEQVADPVSSHVPEVNADVPTAPRSPKARRGRKASSMAISQHPRLVSGNVVNSSSTFSFDEIHDSGHDSDTSMASQSTVIKGGAKRRSSNLKVTKAGKKNVSRNIEDVIHQPVDVPTNEKQIEEVPQKKAVGRPKRVVQTQEAIAAEGVLHAASSMSQESSTQSTSKQIKRKPVRAKGKEKALPDPPAEGQISTVDRTTGPLLESPKRQQPKELTPSLSPQSSDAENQPPSSKPSLVKPPTQAYRIPLAAVTPSASPSKRNIIAGLQSSHPWTAVDLDEALLKSPSDTQAEKENAMAGLLGEAVARGKNGELTSPEKKMTVEEWILFNASLAEERLRSDCERMVGVFEREGGRAMRVLEGVECVE